MLLIDLLCLTYIMKSEQMGNTHGTIILHNHTDLPTKQPAITGLQAKFGQPINRKQHIL